MKIACYFVLGLLLVLVGVPGSAQTIPANAKAACVVPSATFNTWFVSGSPTLNGAVKPANSVAFNHNTANPPAPNTINCNFYAWSMQMFLWLTSPAPPQYGGSSTVMDSPVFFDVSSADSNGYRTLIPHPKNGPFIRDLSQNLRAAQPGPHGLPVVLDTKGRLLEVVPTQNGPNGRPLLLNKAGSKVEVMAAEAKGKTVLQDNNKKEIPVARAIVPLGLAKNRVVAQVPGENGKIVFVDGNGNIVPTEQGQAGGGGVLQPQGGNATNQSLVYYTISVNDVYAYFLTGSKDNKITPTPTTFPTTPAQLAKVVAYAAGLTPPVVFPDPDALTVELKASWVQSSTLPNNGAGHIKIQAFIPTYNTSSNQLWTPLSKKQVELSLIGLHVVGSTAGHPEMVWATFEHIGDTPNATYTYVTSTGSCTAPATETQSTAGPWLFSQTGATGPFNALHMSFVSPNIKAATGSTISPSNTLRVNPWGAGSTPPNPIVVPPCTVPTVAGSNTEVISVNNSVRGQIPAGDARANYFTTGATWTVGGIAPIGPYSGAGTAPNGTEVGTSALANSTMETYQQKNGCFACHGRGSGSVNPNTPPGCVSFNPNKPTGCNSNPISHIYGNIKPLN